MDYAKIWWRGQFWDAYFIFNVSFATQNKSDKNKGVYVIVY